MSNLYTKYNVEIDDSFFEGYKNKLKNQVYKLLPLKEEDGEWEKHLETILIELHGLAKTIITINFISLIAKLEMLKYLDYKYYKKTIFECMNLIDKLNS